MPKSTSSHLPKDSAATESVMSEFKKQEVMRTIGAKLTRATPGRVEIELPFKHTLTQQHGYVHAGMVTTIADSACGYAAWSVSPPESEVLTVEYKVNFLSPAKGTKLVARGRVIRKGKKLTVCAADVFTLARGTEKLVATMLATIMVVSKRERP
jgi:uncharacterized protein (TIGR00369 family)